jgi:hypothetical protein
MFGLSEGSEIGSKGDRDLEVSSFGRLGKASGRYSAFSIGVAGKFNTGDDFRISPGIFISRYDVGGVPGFIDRNGFAFEGANFEMKYRILRRENAPFGLTVGATPFWSRIDPATGGRTREFGSSFFALFDKEIVANNVFAAVNLSYEPLVNRLPFAPAWSRASIFGASGGVAARIVGRLFMGGEIRYAQATEGLFLNKFNGYAVSIGPTLFYKTSETAFIAAVWSHQVAGRANNKPGRLDLENFERNEVRLLYGAAF